MMQSFQRDGSLQLVTQCVDQDMKLGKGENVSNDTFDEGIGELILSATWGKKLTLNLIQFSYLSWV